MTQNVKIKESISIINFAEKDRMYNNMQKIEFLFLFNNYK